LIDRLTECKNSQN